MNRGERIVFWWPNTNTNIIRLFKNDRIRIRILFGLKKATEYEYEYYSVWKSNRIRIRILFGLKKATEYEYYSVWKNRPNTNTNIITNIIWLEKITRIRIRILVFGLNYSNNIRIPNYSLTSDCSQRWQMFLIIMNWNKSHPTWYIRLLFI